MDGELPGHDAVAVTPHELDGAELEEAWRRINEARSRYAKHQGRPKRRYPVIRLTPR